MKKHAFVIAFGLILSAACLSQQPAWKTEHHDTMLVPPNAAHITFIEKGIQDELTYTVEESYPASEFLSHLCEELRLKGWEPSGHDGCPKPTHWMEILTPSRSQYEMTLNWERWENDNWEYVSYNLKFTNDKNEHYLRTLHVDTYANNRVTVPPQTVVTVKPSLSSAQARVLRFCLIFLYFFLLSATVLLFIFTNVRSAVFYNGPSAWLTWFNLVLFGPLVMSFLSFGSILFVAVWPARENIPGEGAVAAAVGTWVILYLGSKAGYVMAPIILLLTTSILFAKGVPRNVKIGHAVLGLLSLSFFVVCIVFFSGPLIRW